MALNISKTVTGIEPVQLDEVKEFLRVDYDADDVLLTSLITQSREIIERYLNISIPLSTLIVEASPRVELQLPYGPVLNIDSVTDRDGNDVYYEWNGFVITFEGNSFSPTQPERPAYVETITTYDSGYAIVPAGLKLAVMEVIAYLYENRGDTSSITLLLNQNKNLDPYRQKIWI
jgi:uncharacterized phiE125 gp8 family phage protein